MLWKPMSSSRVPSALSRLFPETSRLRMVRISRLQGQDGFTANPRSRLGAVPTRGQVALRCIGAQRAEPALHRARRQPCALVAQGHRVRAAPGCRQPRRGAPGLECRFVPDGAIRRVQTIRYGPRTLQPASSVFSPESPGDRLDRRSAPYPVPEEPWATRLWRAGTQKMGWPPAGPRLAPAPAGPRLAPGWPPAGPGPATGWPWAGPRLAPGWPPAGPRLALGWPRAGPRLAGTVLSSGAHSRFPGAVCRQRWTVRLGEVEPVFGQTGRVVLDITARTAHDGALKWTRPSTPRAARSILATFPSPAHCPPAGAGV